MTVKSNPYEWSKFIPLAKNSQKFNLFFGELCNVYNSKQRILQLLFQRIRFLIKPKKISTFVILHAK